MINCGGKIGVNLFVLISGYFLITQEKPKIHKILKLCLMCVFYSVLVYVFLVLLGACDFNIKTLIKSFFPITFCELWFASTYFVLYLIFPFLNSFFKGLTQDKYKTFLLLIGFIWCIIPTFTNSAYESNMLLWFIFIYGIAGYIRIYKVYKEDKKILLVLILTFGLMYLSAIFFSLLGTKIEFFNAYVTYFYGVQKLPILVISVLIFLITKNIKISNSKIISTISSSTFGIYLIHDNKLMRNFIWSTIFNVNSYLDKYYLPLYIIIVVLIVFFTCFFIERVRLYIEQMLETKFLNIASKISCFIENVSNYIKRFI